VVCVIGVALTVAFIYFVGNAMGVGQ
jgi:hypothetical protein